MASHNIRHAYLELYSYKFSCPRYSLFTYLLEDDQESSVIETDLHWMFIQEPRTVFILCHFAIYVKS